MIRSGILTWNSHCHFPEKISMLSCWKSFEPRIVVDKSERDCFKCLFCGVGWD